MFDIAWPELLVVGAVALVVIGPKDLPKAMHTLGTWMGKARRAFLAFQHNMERLAHEAEAAEQLKQATKNETDKEK
jgi:sec-independent protein translocase protein TatB